MSYYTDSNKVEATGLAILYPFITRVTGNDVMPLTDQCLQKSAGDLLANFAKLGWKSVECKIEQKHTGNLFIETWSNREWGTPGWLFTSQADILMVYFLDVDKLICVSLPALKHWLLNKDNPALDRYRSVQVKKQQRNDTHGAVIPIVDIKAEVLECWWECSPAKYLETQQCLSEDARESTH